MQHGLLLLNKPTGITSNAALSRVKRILKTKKAGFAGTLDPMASGVLPIALGEATKCLPYIENVDKEYEFTVRWGAETDTLDAEGTEIRRQKTEIRKENILEIIPEFTGEISQIPPAYSAIKINGQRAYDLARAGEVPEMKARRVTIHKLELLSLSCHPWDCRAAARAGDPQLGNPEILELETEGTRNNGSPVPAGGGPRDDNKECASFRVVCSKGTYIRSLARDMAYALGTLGHLTMLRRTRVGKFVFSDTISLEKLLSMEYEMATQWVMPIRRMLDDILAIRLDPGALRRLRQGQSFDMAVTAATLPPGTNVLILDGEAAFGIGVIKDDKMLWPRRIFNL